MRLGNDIGNFIMLILGAGLAAALLGDWAGTTVLVIGMGVMVIGAVAYVMRGLGITLDARPSAPSTPKGRALRNPDRDVEVLLQAVAKQDEASIERLVIDQNVSPFQNAPWQGKTTSAYKLAVSMSYTPGVSFFREWSAKGSAAHFPQSAQGQP